MKYVWLLLTAAFILFVYYLYEKIKVLQSLEPGFVTLGLPDMTRLVKDGVATGDMVLSLATKEGNVHLNSMIIEIVKNGVRIVQLSKNNFDIVQNSKNETTFTAVYYAAGAPELIKGLKGVSYNTTVTILGFITLHSSGKIS